MPPLYWTPSETQTGSSDERSVGTAASRPLRAAATGKLHLPYLLFDIRAARATMIQQPVPVLWWQLYKNRRTTIGPIIAFYSMDFSYRISCAQEKLLCVPLPHHKPHHPMLPFSRGKWFWALWKIPYKLSSAKTALVVLVCIIMFVV
jgi:hypothetical protein